MMLRVNHDGVMMDLRGGADAISFRWDEVGEVVTFQRDPGTNDDIRLAFYIPAVWIELSEPDDGFMDLVDVAAQHIPTTHPFSEHR